MKALFAAVGVMLLVACSERPAPPQPAAAPSATPQGFKIPAVPPPAGKTVPLNVMANAASVKVTYQQQKGEINTNDGGRGLYWEHPDGHWLEILTVPYGGWPD